jgi:hypothetical protein
VSLHIPTPAEIAQVRHALAALAEGFCPRCRSRLEPLTVKQVVRTAGWPHQPVAWCSTCEGIVGKFRPPNQGVFVASGDAKTDVTP